VGTRRVGADNEVMNFQDSWEERKFGVGTGGRERRKSGRLRERRQKSIKKSKGLRTVNNFFLGGKPI